MRFGVVVFPGSNCEQDVVYAARYLGFDAEYVWHGDADLEGFDAVILPGGFSYGDVLGAGEGFEVRTEADLEQALTAALDNTEQFSLLNVHLSVDDHSQALNRLSKRLTSQVRPTSTKK